MVLETGAIGDVYGRGFEFVKDKEFIKRNNTLEWYCKNPDSNKHIPGMYTDDTQMSLALAKLMLEKDEWRSDDIIWAFIDGYRRDRREDMYSRKFQGLLDKVLSLSEDKEELIEHFKENIKANGTTNGAIMRVPILGFYSDENEVINKAKLQASVSHNTFEAKISAQAIALTSHYFIHKKGPKSNLINYLEQKLENFVYTPNEGFVSMQAVDTANACLSIILKYDKMSDILRESINRGGDTDSVASISLGCLAYCNEVENDIPKVLYKCLENGIYGREYLREIDDKLREKFL